MNNSIVPFNFDGQAVRVVTIDGEPWFVLNDLCATLGILNVGNVLARLADDQKSSVRLTDGTPGNPNRAIVNESGMWTVILRSDAPNAKRLRRWVTDQVLPQIRKTGSYGATPALTGPELLAHAVIEAQAMITAQTEHIAQLEPKAEYVDTYVADSDLRLLRNIAKSLGITESDLRNLLIERNWIYAETTSRWSARREEKVTTTRYSAYANKRDHFRPVPTHDAPRFKGEVMHTLKVTPTGATAIARLIKRNGLELAS